ncbi:MAG: diguanylate cyclase [Oceanospirillaceae bacterium]|nr:diguanylate cyclase [Oceanospirillaceae bacterium]MCP5350865.1 diguanylate cyclase [Oceanospirillaceae bacterium]
MYRTLMKLGSLQGDVRDEYLEELANLFVTITGSIDAGVVVHDHEGKIVFCNPASLDLLGLSEEQIMGTEPLDPIWALIDETGQPLDHKHFPALEVLHTREAYFRPCIGVRTPQGIRWARVKGVPMFAGQGFNAIITFTDITNLIESQRLRSSLDSMWQSIYSSAPIGICITDSTGIFRKVNRAYCEFYGYSEAELLGQHFTKVVPEPHKITLSKLHDDFIHTGDELRGEWPVQDAKGEIKYVLADACRITAVDGSYHKVTFIIDITGRKALEQEMQVKNRLLKEFSIRDGLTGTYNRRFFEERLPVMVAEMSRYQTTATLLMLDIDHFKDINDNLGHQAGDDILQGLAQCLKEGLREADVLMRYGGEEFAIFLPHTDAASGLQIAERLRQSVEKTLATSEAKPTISIGIAQFQQGESQFTWIKRADKALYEAKEQGRNRSVLHP